MKPIYKLGGRFPGGKYVECSHLSALSGTKDVTLSVEISPEQTLKLVTVHGTVGTTTRQDDHGFITVKVQEPVAELSSLQAGWLARALRPVIEKLMVNLPPDEKIFPEMATPAEPAPQESLESMYPPAVYGGLIRPRADPRYINLPDFRTTILVTDCLAQGRMYDHDSVVVAIQKLNQKPRYLPIVLDTESKRLIDQVVKQRNGADGPFRLDVPTTSILGYASDFQVEGHKVTASLGLIAASFPNFDPNKLAFRPVSITKQHGIEGGALLEVIEIPMIAVMPTEQATHWEDWTMDKEEPFQD